MKFCEAEVMVASDGLRRRGVRDLFRVLNESGNYEYFESASDANRVFPGAFDLHPDFDTE